MAKAQSSPENRTQAELDRAQWDSLFNSSSESIWVKTDITKAKEASQKAIEIAHRHNWHKELARSYQHLGIIARNEMLLDNSWNYFLQTVEFSKKAEYPRGMFSGYAGMVAVCSSKGLLVESEEFARKALSVAIDNKLDDKIAAAQNNLGAVLIERGKIEEAVEIIIKSNEFAKKTKNWRLMVYNFSEMLSRILLSRMDYDAALSFATQGLEYAKLSNTQKELGIAKETLCCVYTAIGKVQEAIQNGEDAITLYDQAGLENSRVKALVSLATAYAGTKNYEKATTLIEESISKFRSANELALVDALAVLGKIHIDNSAYTSAIAVLQEASDRIEHLDNASQKYLILSRLAEAFEQSGNCEAAIRTLKLSYSAERQQFNRESDLRLESVKIQMNIERIERESEIQSLRAEKAEQQLALQATSLAAQTELLARFRDELRQIVREIDDPINALKKIKERLKTLPCQEVDWVKFEQDFVSVHPEFRKKLHEKYPALSNQELRLCQLLRTGLKSHEAARLMCITERGVETHRLRIRRKLGIHGNASLTEFLQKV